MPSPIAGRAGANRVVRKRDFAFSYSGAAHGSHMDIETIQGYGNVFYAISFVWTFFEGETFVLFGGLAAQRGILRLELLIACAWLGSFCGDQAWFWLGRQYGHRLLARLPRLKPGVDRALEWLTRYNTGFILTYRFIYGVRNFSSVALGMSDLPWTRFLVLNFIAAGIWATSFATVGFVVGEAVDAVLADNVQAFSLSMLALFVGVIAVKALLHWRRKARATGFGLPARPAIPPTKALQAPETPASEL